MGNKPGERGGQINVAKKQRMAKIEPLVVMEFVGLDAYFNYLRTQREKKIISDSAEFNDLTVASQ